MYTYGLKKNIYEACSYSIYWALKYDFDIEISTIKQDSISSLDCVFLLISYQYDKKHRKKSYLKEYRDLAKYLKEGEHDRYWLYIFETLSWAEQVGDYRAMKKSGLTFIKPEFN